MNEKLLRAFFHRGRKKFLPWLNHELARRVDADPIEVERALRMLSRQGLVYGKQASREVDARSAFELTSLGRAEVMQMLMAEEQIKRVKP